MSSDAWQVFDLPELIKKASDKGAGYQEFLREASLSCGIYRLSAGSKDMQGFHDEDNHVFSLCQSGFTYQGLICRRQVFAGTLVTVYPGFRYKYICAQIAFNSPGIYIIYLPGHQGSGD